MHGFSDFAARTDGEIIGAYLSRPDVRVSDIAAAFGLSEAEVYRTLHANDITPNRRAVNHQKVVGLADLGWDTRQIAELTGYTPRNVRYILRKSISEAKK